jgi:hypothetical protein
MKYTFKFVDQKLQRQLLRELKKAKAVYWVDADDAIQYSDDQVDLIENRVLSAVRGRAFQRWQILSCPAGWSHRYKEYMVQHQIPFVEELIDNRLCFLLPRAYRPHSWKFAEARRKVS